MSSPINTSENDLAAIRQELNELRQAVGAMRSNGNGHDKGNGTSFLEVAESTALTDRRGMMKKVAGLAVGVAAAGLLLPSRSGATVPAPQKRLKGQPGTTGNPLLLGENNASTGTDETILNNETAGLDPVLFLTQNYGTSPFSPPSGTSIALAAYTDDTGATSEGDPIYAVYAQANSVNGVGIGVFGTGSDTGVSGSGFVGVSGTGSGDGCGVMGTSDGAAINAYGVMGEAATGSGGAFEGGRCALVLFAGSGAVADPNVTLPGFGGDLYRGSTNASLWYNAGGTIPYQRVADATTAGALTAFPASSRFVNLSLLNAGTTNTYQIGGMTVNGNTVPAFARAIIARIADANPTGGGGAILVGATNPPVGGVIAVVAGAPQNSYFFSALDATGKLYVKNSSPSGSVQIIIDIQGYYE